MRKVNARQDEGMVTAEAAIVIPSLFLVLALALAAIVTVGAKVKVVDAAREAARIAARGETPGHAEEMAKKVAPHGATVDVESYSGWVHVTVKATIRPFSSLPGITVTETAVAEREDS